MTFLRARGFLLMSAIFTPPIAPLERLRLLLLLLAVASAVPALGAQILVSESLATSAGVTLVMIALVLHWAIGYRRTSFPLWAEPLEVAALFVLLRAVPGDPFLPLFGLIFRSLYGTLPIVLTRYALWMSALVGAHAPRGSVHLEEDVERIIGMVIAPGVMHTLNVALARLQANERRLGSLVQNATDVISVIGDDLRVRWQADSIRTVLGYEPNRVLRTPVLDLVHEDDRPVLERYFESAREHAGLAETLALRVRHRDGSYRHVEVVAANRLHDESVRGFVLNMRDATDRLRLESELRELAAQCEYDALHDPLTKLPNRRQLFAEIEKSVARAREDGQSVALLLIDLDHFKELNDTLGHGAGDALLAELRPRLSTALEGSELVARIGGDEFAVLLSRGQEAEHAREVGERLLAAIQKPFQYQQLTIVVRASVGIALYPDHAQDVETLMQRADVAMYSAKAGNRGVEIYNASRDGNSRQRLTLIGELPQAIAAHELIVMYQPQIDLGTGLMTGAEALVRWQHPRYGLLGPDAFLPMAEQIGLMRPLTLHVLDQALADLAGWRRQGFDVSVAVNLAAPNLIDLALPGDVAQLLDKWGIEPHHLRLEVTETIIGADPVRVGEILTLLRDMGVIIALDDFGTGSSSLSFLRKLPVDELKIDKSFVFGMDRDPHAAAIVRAVVTLAHELELKAVAEGVETDGVRKLLVECGCDHAQGFLFGRPIPPKELLARIRDINGLESVERSMPWERRLPVRR